MTEPLDQIGAAPRVRLRGVGLKFAWMEIKIIPRPKTRPNAERKHEAVWLGRHARRATGIEKRSNRQDIVARHLREPLIGEGRVEIFPVPANALMEGAVEFIISPGADALGLIRRDVGRIERAIADRAAL